MPGNPEQCRLNAARCLKLAKRTRRPELRETFTALADTWKRLAAEHESDEALLRAISELEFSKPYEALPLALKLRSWPTSVTKGALSRHRAPTLSMSAYGGKADIPSAQSMSANDPKRTRFPEGCLRVFGRLPKGQLFLRCGRNVTAK